MVSNTNVFLVSGTQMISRRGFHVEIRTKVNLPNLFINHSRKWKNNCIVFLLFEICFAAATDCFVNTTFLLIIYLCGVKRKHNDSFPSPIHFMQSNSPSDGIFFQIFVFPINELFATTSNFH